MDRMATELHINLSTPRLRDLLRDPRLVTELEDATGCSSISKVTCTMSIRTQEFYLSLAANAAACGSSGTKSSIKDL